MPPEGRLDIAGGTRSKTKSVPPFVGGATQCDRQTGWRITCNHSAVCGCQTWIHWPLRNYFMTRCLASQRLGDETWNNVIVCSFQKNIISSLCHYIIIMSLYHHYKYYCYSIIWSCIHISKVMVGHTKIFRSLASQFYPFIHVHFMSSSLSSSLAYCGCSYP